MSPAWTLAALTSVTGLVACTGASVSIGGVPLEQGGSGGASGLGSFGQGGTAGPVDAAGTGGGPNLAEGGDGTGEAGNATTGGRAGANAGLGGTAGSGVGTAGSGAGTAGSAVHSQSVGPPHVAPCMLAEPCRATLEWRDLTTGVGALSGDGQVLVGIGEGSLSGQALRMHWAENTVDFVEVSTNIVLTATNFLGDAMVGYDLGQAPMLAIEQVGDRPFERVPGSNDGTMATAISNDGQVILTTDWASETGGQILRDGVATWVGGFELTAMNSDSTLIGGDRGQDGFYTTVLLNQSEDVVAELGRAGEQSPVHVTALSADGSVAVGIASRWADVMTGNPSSEHAYRWSNGATELLAEPPGWDGSQAFGCDATGSVIVGVFTFPGYKWPEAFVYTESDGMLDLPTLLEGRGLALPDGFYPMDIYVSDDGKVLAGEAMLVTESNPSPYYGFPWRVTLDD